MNTTSKKLTRLKYLGYALVFAGITAMGSFVMALMVACAFVFARLFLLASKNPRPANWVRDDDDDKGFSDDTFSSWHYHYLPWNIFHGDYD